MKKAYSGKDTLEKNKYVSCLKVLFGVSLFMTGLYYELACALTSIALLIWLVLYSRKNTIIVKKSVTALTISVYFAAYLIAPLWAEDKGLAAFGLVKALPVFLFAICLMQLDAQERRKLMLDLPLLGSCMVIVSDGFRWIPVLQDLFLVNGRLGGFFQYPNTFACFLLICFELLLLDERQQKKWQKIAEGVILVLGFLQAGSRAAFLIAILGVAATLVVMRKKRAIIIGAACIAGSVILIVVPGLFSGSATGHMLDISLNASTLLGRLLYWQDVLPIIGKHPFGIGYLGYYFMQGTFQTGVYSVRWIHNDFLQILLDIGWIPAILCLITIVYALKAKTVLPRQKIILSTLILHAFVDFDLQYVSMFFILLLNLDWDSGKSVAVKKKNLFAGVFSVVTALTLWLGISSGLAKVGNNTAAVEVYPWNTLSQLQLLTSTTDIDEYDARSKRILRQNKYSATAWDAQAELAWRSGDFAGMIQAKQEAISHNKYDIREYTDYMDKLLESIERCRKSDQGESLQLCMKELLAIPERLNEVLDGSSALAWKIVNTPKLTLPQEYLDILQTITGGQENESF